MKKLTQDSQLVRGEYYLVKINFDWSPSSHDIAEWDGKQFISQSNGQVIEIDGVEEYQSLEQ